MARVPGIKRLRFQLAAILAVAMLPAGIIALFQAGAIAQEGARRSVALLEGEAYIAAAGERRVMIEVRERLRSAARQIATAKSREQACDIATSALFRRYDWGSSFGVFDGDGLPLCGIDSPIDLAATPEWIEFAAKGDFTLGPPREAPGTGQLIIPAYHPIDTPDKRFAAIAAGIDVGVLKALAAPALEGNLGAYPLALIGNGGSVVMLEDDSNTDWLPRTHGVLLGQSPGTKRSTAIDGREYYYITNPISAGQLWAVMGIPDPPVWKQIFSGKNVVTLAPVALWLIAVSVVFFAMDRLVTRHINDISRIATRIGRGELDIQIRDFDDAPAEVKRLGDAVRMMAHNLLEREGRLRELLQSQRSLLLEVHHRVKNNLQMISSLVNMQLRRSGTEGESDALQIVQDRIHSLALVHQNLYATERLDHVALDELLRDLCAHLTASLSKEDQKIEFDLALDHVTVDAEVATPVALFLTEALSNVFKHASKDEGGESRIRITLEGLEDRFRLRVRNPTAPKPEDGGDYEGLGSRLMRGFAAQLGGSASQSRGADFFEVSLDAPIARRSGENEFKVRNIGT